MTTLAVPSGAPSGPHRADRPRRPVREHRRTGASVLACLGAFLVLSGCAGAEEGEVARAADAFAAGLRDDPSAACVLLAPETLSRLEEEGGAGCVEALPATGMSDPGRRLQVTVAGHAAQARFTEDTLFLALFDDGWKVVAAGCERASGDPADPYDCDVEGA